MMKSGFWIGVAGLALSVLPACKSSAKEEAPPSETPAEEVAAEGAVRAAEDEQKVRAEYESVMYARHVDLARKYRNSLELDNALAEVDRALGYRPSEDEAIKLRAEILRLLGDRTGETRTVIEDQYEAFEAKREEQKVAVRRLIGEGQQAMAAGSYPEADKAYERALFIVNSAKLSPLGTDDDLAKLGSDADAGKKELERRMAEADAEQERRDTDAALREVAEIEEKQLLEARDRRAGLLSNAIDAFNREEFDLAEDYAGQVLREEPDNRVAHDIVENARRGRHTAMNVAYLRELKDGFRRWQIDIERTKIPSAKILQWPSQSFWDRISRLRAARDVGGGVEMSPEEQAVLNTLDTRTIDLPFEAAMAFPQLVEYLSASSGVNFVIDPRAREELDAAEVTIRADRVTVKDALDLVLMQVSAEGTITYEITGNVVRFLKKEHLKVNRVLRIHPVADLTLGLTDFIPPEITQVMVDDDSEAPLFGAEAAESPQAYGTLEELAELVRNSISPEVWEGGSVLNPQGRNLIVYAPPDVQAKISLFLDDLRAFAQIIVTIEGRILRVGDAFFRDVGVDLRGTGGTNGGPLAVLDDVTNGLVNNASGGFDNSGPGVGGGGAALSPSSGIFFSDGSDGDFRARSENVLAPIGGLLSGLGGGTFQTTYLDDLQVSAVLRATEKTAMTRRMRSVTVSVYNSQRAYLSSVNQIAFISDFDVEVAQTAFIADPVIGIIQEGIVLDVRPIVSNDRQYITLDMGTAVMDLHRPIETFTTNMGQAAVSEPLQGPPQLTSKSAPVTIQLPELDWETTGSSSRIPDGGSVLLSGLKRIGIQDQEASSPILGDIPVLGFLFQRRAKSDEVLHRMAIITATITDLNAQQ
jgi:general secretion pathway protein D